MGTFPRPEKASFRFATLDQRHSPWSHPRGEAGRPTPVSQRAPCTSVTAGTPYQCPSRDPVPVSQRVPCTSVTTGTPYQCHSRDPCRFAAEGTRLKGNPVLQQGPRSLLLPLLQKQVPIQKMGQKKENKQKEKSCCQLHPPKLWEQMGFVNRGSKWLKS